MTKSPWKNVPDVGIELGAACMPSELTSDRIGLRSDTGRLDYESRDPVLDPETLPFKYFGQPSFYLKKIKPKIMVA